MFQDVPNYPTWGAYTGFGNPFYTQQNPFQGVQNPYTGGQQGMGQQTYGGIPGYGTIHPLAALIAAQQHPLLQAVLQNPILAQHLASQLQGGQPGQQGGIQHPILQAILQNPLLAQHLMTQLQTGLLGQQGSPYGQQQGNPYAQQQGNPYAQQHGNPYGQQQGNPYGQQQGWNPYGQQQGWNPYGQQGQGMPLAPQTWIGQGGQFGQQIHPLLAQLLAARQGGGPGIPGFGLGY